MVFRQQECCHGEPLLHANTFSCIIATSEPVLKTADLNQCLYFKSIENLVLERAGHLPMQDRRRTRIRVQVSKVLSQVFISL